MNTSIQHSGPNASFEPSNQSLRRETPAAWRMAAGRLTRAVLLSAVLLLFGASIARADRSPAGCTGSGLGISLFTSLPDVHIGDTIFYSALVFNSPFPACDAGETNMASAGAIQAFIVTPDGVTNYITLRRTFLAPGESDYYTNVVRYVVRAQDIRVDGTVRATAEDDGDIHQNVVNSRGGGNQGVNTQVNLPCVLITAQCVGSVGDNGAITFSGTVTNCGNNTLVGVTVTNFNDNGFFTVLFPTNLAFGQVSSFSGSWVPANPCGPSTAILTVLATDQFTATPRTLTNFTTITCQNTLTPGIKVTTSCPAQPVAPGQLLTFSGSVSNTGNVTLTNIVVVDTQPSANTPVFTLGTLAPGAVANFTGSYLAPTNCASTHTLTANAASVCGVAVSSSATATCPVVTTPQIKVTANCPATPAVPGGLLTFSGTVTNTGDITLTNVVVVSDRPVANTVVFTVATLAPGVGTNYTASFSSPANACSVITSVAASGHDICTGALASQSVSITCPILTAPAVAVTLACPAVPVVTGGVITYTGTVRNSGNVTLNNLIVIDNQAVPSTVLTVASLTPGASTNFTTSFTAPADTCSVSSTVAVSGLDSCTGIQVNNSASATCPLVTAPRIVVTQNCPANPTSLGGTLTYSGSVSNAGNITLTNIVITNDRTGATPIFVAAILSPGQGATFTGSYIVPASSGCSIASTVTASGSDKCTGTPVTASASATCSLVGDSRIAVTLACPTNPVSLGGILTYSGTVNNPGNVVLTNVVVTSDLPTPGTVVFSRSTLAPGASANFTGSYTVPSSDICSITTSVTVRASDQCANAGVINTATITCPVDAAPRILVTQVCPANAVAPGGLITYSGSVSNTGNITLTNVTVFGSQPAVNTLVFTVASLAPGAAAPFSTSFNAPLDACSATSTLTASGQNHCDGKSVTNSVTTTCPLVTAPQISVTKTCPAGTVSEGGLLVFTGTVTNTGNITLTNVVVVNNHPVANTRVLGPITLAPGAGTNFTGSYNAPLNTCSVTDTLIATGLDKCTGNTASNSITTTCPVGTIPRLTVTLACPATPATVGGPITFTGTVSNPGNVTMNNVTVVDNQAVPRTVLTVASLAAGASANFSASFTAPADTCSVNSTVTAFGQDNCSGVSVTNSASATCPLVTIPGIVVTQVCPAVPATPGSLLAYSGTVRNSGNVSLTNIVVLNNLSGATPVFTSATLAPGETADFSGSYLAPTNCSSTSIATATGHSICGQSVTNSTTTSCPILTAPQVAVTVVCPVNPTAPGAVLTYTGTVRNSGNITLSNVVVISDRPAANTTVFTGATLAPGASAAFTGSYTVPIDVCPITATIKVTAEDVCNGAAVTDTFVSTCSVSAAPAIAVTLACPAGTGGIDLALNQNATESSTYVYNGHTNSADLAVDGNTDGTAFNPSVAITGFESNAWWQVDLGSVQTLHTVNVWGRADTALDQSSNLYLFVSDTPFTSGSLSATLAQPGVTSFYTPGYVGAPGVYSVNRTGRYLRVQLAGKNFLALAEVQAYAPSGATNGPTLTYTGTVRNSGNVTLNNVTVVNNQPAPNTVVFTTASLAPGGSASFTASITAPADTCSVSSTVTATGTDNCTRAPVSNTATATCGLPTQPGIAITQVCPASPAIPGSPLTYGGTVRNTGNVTLTNVIVLNNRSGPTPVFTLGSLAPGETVNFTGSYLAPTNCSSTSISTATGSSICGVSVTNSATATCPVLQASSIEVTQSCAATPVVPGGILKYTGTVHNSGDVTLTNVVVVSDRPGSNTVIFTIATLAPGATANFTGSYQVPLNCCVSSSTVEAKGQDICAGVTVTDFFTATCPTLTLPQIVVTKVCPPTPVQPGDLLRYSGSVSNAGNIVLVNVTVVNNQPNAGSPLLGPIALAPGESVSYYASYVVPPDFCGTDTVTARGLDGCTLAPMVNSISTACSIITTPRIFVTKNCPAQPTPRGGLFIFTGTVSNPGNVTLTNVVVENNYEVDCYSRTNGPVIGPITLAPGASVNFSGSYTAPRSCCEVVDTLTATGQDRCTGVHVAATATAVCPLVSTPGISITRVCPASPIPVGGLFVFTGSVTNTGDVVLTNVFVFSNQANTNATLLGPLALAPGESEEFTGSYIVTAGSDPATNTVTAVGTDSCQARTVSAMANCSGPIATVLPLITLVTTANGIVTVSWTSRPGTTYCLQSKDGAAGSSWINIPGNVTAGGTSASKSDNAAMIRLRFYRVVVVNH